MGLPFDSSADASTDDFSQSQTGATPIAKARPALMELSGTTLCYGRFEVCEPLGRGGQGAVFRVLRHPLSADSNSPTETVAVDEPKRFVPRPLRTPSEAALKVFLPDPARPSLTERLIAEYRIAARLKDASFVRAYEMFEHQGLLCYTMDLMPGGSLAQSLGQPMLVAVAVGLVLDVLEGLDQLHSIGVVHRDIKHHNILLRAPFLPQARESIYPLPQACLSDFGISDVQDMVFGDRAFYSMAGSLQFMAPELGVRDKVDARVDLYAVGVLLFMLLTGRHPVSQSTSRGQTIASLQAQLGGSSVQRLHLREIAPNIPKEVEEVVTQLVEPDPERRLRTAALAFDRLYNWFCSHASEHKVKLSHVHRLRGQPYLTASAFCGRTVELAKAQEFLSAQIEPLPAGTSPSVLVLWGEAGVGKTRLTSHIRRLAYGLNYEVHSFLAQPRQGAYQSFLALQRTLEDHYQQIQTGLTPDEREQHRAPDHPLWVPDINQDAAYALLRQTQVRSDERTLFEELHERYQLERFAALLRLRSAAQAQCLIIEDAQWLDNATLKFLSFAIRFIASSNKQGRGGCIAWIFNHRPKDNDGDNLDALEDHLRSIGKIASEPVRLEIRAFGVAQATELAASMLQLPPGDVDLQRFIAALGRQRELTPLFVEQTLWLLFSRGILTLQGTDRRWDGKWNLDLTHLEQAGVPATVREAIGGRASHLHAETLRILSVAALSGKEFDVEVVARAAAAHADDVLTACEQAGRAGFLVHAHGDSQSQLADSGQSEVSFRFAHDRYREAILGRLEAGVRKQLHSALARAVAARWGTNQRTYAVLAEHAYGAEEYGQAYEYALAVAEEAYTQGLHERAAEHYQLALASHKKDLNRKLAITLEIRDRAAQSFNAIGHYQEAEVQLTHILEHENLTDLTRFDYQRRLAGNKFRQQDYKNAVAEMIIYLEKIGIHLPIHGLEGLRTVIHGLFLLILGGKTDFFINLKPCPEAEYEALLVQALSDLVNYVNYVDVKLALKYILYVAIRCMKNGLHEYSPILFSGFSGMTALLGMHAISRRYDILISQNCSHCETLTTHLYSNKKRQLTYKQYELYALTAAYRILAATWRAELSQSYEKQLSRRIQEANEALCSCADPFLHWTVKQQIQIILLFSGRINYYLALTADLINYLIKNDMRIFTQISKNAQCGWMSCLRGEWSQARVAYETVQNIGCDAGTSAYNVFGESQKLLCEALDTPIPRAELTSESTAVVARYLDKQLSNSLAFTYAAVLSAATITIYRHGIHRIPWKLRKQLWRAYYPCMAQGPQRPLYRAVQATVAAIEGKTSKALKFLAQSTTDAVEHGLLLQLYFVLNISVRIIPKNDTMHAFYQTWLDSLQRNLLNQPPVDLRQIENGLLPPAPNHGRP